MNRRDFIESGCAALALSAAGCRSSGDPPCVTFGLVADIHYADIDDAIGRHYRDAAARLADCVRTMNGLKPDFLVELGDFKDLGTSREATLVGLKRIEGVFAGFEGPRYHVLSNHDFDILTPDEFLSGISNAGQVRAKAYYRFDVRCVTFLVLDGCHTSDMRHYSRANPWDDANLPPEQMAWLARELRQAAGPVVVFCHQPIDPEADARHRMRNAAEVRMVLERSGKVVAVFAGHQHWGGHCCLNGIAYHTLPAIVEGEGSAACALATVFADGRVSVRGCGRSNFAKPSDSARFAISSQDSIRLH